MTKRILSFLAILSTLLLGSPYITYASSNTVSATIEVLPEGAGVTSGFLNTLSTGFRVNIELENGFKPDNLELFVGSGLTPIDSEIYDNGTNYILSSGTASLADLKSLLLTHSGNEEGSNQIIVKGVTGAQTDILYQGQLISDFSPPQGDFVFQGESGHIYRVGNELPIVFTPEDQPDEYSVSALINGRELTFNRQGSEYISRYIVEEADTDLSTEAILKNIVIIDKAGNRTEYPELALPIDFSVDANSPRVAFTYPDENGVINQSSVQATYLASGYSQLSFYLNDRSISSLALSDLATGSYVLKIIAVDEAGNQAVAIRNFSVDITPPHIVLDENNKQIFESEDLSVSGRSEPLSRILLSLDGLIYDLVTDSDGNFRFVIKDLKAGNYKCSISAFDKYGNQTSIDLGEIIVNVKEQPNQSIIVAQVPVARDYLENDSIDTGQQLFSKAEAAQDEEVAKEGKIISAFDSREKQTTNYLPYFIAFALLIFSIAISSAGYYGMALVGSRNKYFKHDEEPTYFEQEVSKISVGFEQKIGESKEDDSESSDKLRW